MIVATVVKGIAFKRLMADIQIARRVSSHSTGFPLSKLRHSPDEFTQVTTSILAREEILTVVRCNFTAVIEVVEASCGLSRTKALIELRRVPAADATLRFCNDLSHTWTQEHLAKGAALADLARLKATFGALSGGIS
jgi:hypothetical protein